MKDLARKVHRQVKDLFIWTADKEVFGESDHWKSFADEVERGDVFKGDCDDFSLSCSELLIRQGTDPTKIRIAYCKTETGVGHLVCICDGWVIDNRQRDIIAWDDLPYEWHKSMRIDEKGIWRSINYGC